MYTDTAKIQMYNRQTFVTEDDIGMSKPVLQNEKCCFLFKNCRCSAVLIYRGYYMTARGYEFYLRVFNSISHE